MVADPLAASGSSTILFCSQGEGPGQPCSRVRAGAVPLLVGHPGSAGPMPERALSPG
jgi:hypothetical protein